MANDFLFLTFGNRESAIRNAPLHLRKTVSEQLAANRQWLFVLTRVYLGVTFFFSDHGNARPNELSGFLKFAARNGYASYQHFLNSFVMPHSTIFGTLIVVAEIYAGIALVIGFTTRIATCVALFLLVNYMRAKGAVPWGPGIDQSDIVL